MRELIHLVMGLTGFPFPLPCIKPCLGVVPAVCCYRGGSALNHVCQQASGCFAQTAAPLLQTQFSVKELDAACIQLRLWPNQ